MNRILTSTMRVAEQSKHVKIDRGKIRQWADGFDPGDLKNWLETGPFDLSVLDEKDRLHFLMVLNAISFSYWGDPKWQVEQGDEEFDGAYGMISALGQAWEDGVPITDFGYLREISQEDLEVILKGNVEIPLFRQRLEILREVGTVMTKQYSGNGYGMLERAKSAEALLNLITRLFPSFEDRASYADRRVDFNKRAQLLVADICHHVTGVRERVGGIAELTACADYKLPQVLRRDGILDYSKRLERELRQGTQMRAGYPMEVEIRSNTIQAVELMRRALRGRGVEVTANQINDHLWLEGQKKLPDDEPYHLVRTTAY